MLHLAGGCSGLLLDYDYLALDCTNALGVLFALLLDLADAVFRLGEVPFSLGDSLLVILNASQATRQILYGLIVLGLAAIYARTSSSN